MTDQASTLRFIASNAPSLGLFGAETEIALEQTIQPRKKPRYVAITSGKGGVGKSNLSVNLALELGALDKKVALLDADFGLANIDLLLNISPQFHLGHVVKGLKDLSDITIDVTENVSLIPSGSGFDDLANVTLAIHSYLFAKLRAMEQNQDFILIDTAAGIAENVAGVVISAEEVIVVVTPEPTSIVDAYATIKLILRHSPGKQISIVVNSVVGVGDAERVFLQIHSAVRGFLGHEIEYLGMIPRDSNVGEAVREQVPVVQYAPDSPAARAIRLIAKQFQNRKTKETDFAVETQSFWEMIANNASV
ncbi:MAG: MinD/ParA family protein [Pyrinomonadaceae bacterium]